MLSFNNIVAAHWSELANKHFIRTDTNEFLGYVYAKYDNKWSLATICTNGRIEFYNMETNKKTTIFGEDIDTQLELFKEA